MPGMMMDTPDRATWKPPTRESPTDHSDDVASLYESVNPEIDAMISGKGFDPYASEMQSAFSRMQRNRRASAARGMGGMALQGMGAGYAADVDAGLASQQMQNIFDIGQGRQEMKERGVGMKMGQIAQAEQIRVGRETLDLQRLDSDRRYELAKGAQEIERQWREGQLSIAQAELKMQQLMQKLRRESVDISNRRNRLEYRKEYDAYQNPPMTMGGGFGSGSTGTGYSIFDDNSDPSFQGTGGRYWGESEQDYMDRVWRMKNPNVDDPARNRNENTGSTYTSPKGKGGNNG